MKSYTPRFNTKDHPEFFTELRSRVNAHFKVNGISSYANFNMVFKSVFMIALYFVPLILMLTGVVSSFWGIMGMWALMGLGMSGIGLSIMHDANHGSYSKMKWVNQTFGFMVNFIGGYHINWKIQHNLLHHSFTNVNGHDEDIEKTGIMRFSPHQERKNIYRFQAYYATFLYGIMTIYWLTAKDFQQLYRYGKRGLLASQGMSYKKAMTYVLLFKAGYFLLTLVLPLLLLPIMWWQVLLGFLLMHFISGIVLAYIFQSAHVIEETHFFEPGEKGSMENSWAIHQLKTTANFANKSRLFSWLVGGLNYQIEHHLFPNICHVHYRKISKIVKETAHEFNLPYHQHPTFIGALGSHFKLLHRLGTGRYDTAQVSNQKLPVKAA